MIRARLTTCAAAAAAALLAAACGSANPAASGIPGVSSPPATRTASGAARATGSPGPMSASPTGPASPIVGGTTSASPAATTAACAALARHTFLRITAVRSGINGVLTVTGHPASVVCGGADDYHYNLATMAVTWHVMQAAPIKVFPLPTMHLVTITHAELASYLATDQDTRIFLVTGPISRITALQEEFHP